MLARSQQSQVLECVHSSPDRRRSSSRRRLSYSTPTRPGNNRWKERIRVSPQDGEAGVEFTYWDSTKKNKLRLNLRRFDLACILVVMISLSWKGLSGPDKTFIGLLLRYLAGGG